MHTKGNRIIIKDLATQKEGVKTGSGMIVKEAGVYELIKGKIEYLGDVEGFQVGDVVLYSPKTGSEFYYEGEKYRSITNPKDSVVFIEREA
jgi:co-chaperonin GroES (HSP10)